MSDRFVHYAAALLALVVVACLDDPAGPSTLTVALDGGSLDTVWSGAPGEALPRIRIRIKDDAGHPIPGASVTWETAGQRSGVASVVTETNASGEASAVWTLGTNAAEEQRLHVSVQTRHHETAVTVRARAVPYVVSQIRVVIDTPAVVRLGDSVSVAVSAIDPYGNVFPAPDVTLWVTDTAIGAVTGTTFVGGPHRGRASVLVASHGVATAFPVRVTQYVAAIVPVSDTLRFSALGAERRVAYVVRDDRGRAVADTTVSIAVADTGVAQLNSEYVRALAPGLTALRLALGPVATTIVVDVQQRIGSLRLLRDTIRLDALLDTTTVIPIVHDSLGSPIPNPVLEYDVSDARVAKFAAARILQSITPGSAIVTVRDTATGISTSAPVVVRQLIAKIDVTPPQVAFDALGDTLTLSAVGEDRLGSVVSGAALEFSVRDAGVASFQAGSQLRSIALGRTLAIVTDPETGIVATAEVQVAQRVADLKLSADSVVFDAVGDTLRLGFAARDRLGARAGSAAATYTSSDASVVTVTSDGMVEARRNGSAVVVGQSADGPADTAFVSVAQRVAALTLSVDSIAFDALLDTSQVNVVGHDRLGVIVGDAAGRSSYFSTDPAVAGVSGSGAVHSVGNGSALVIAQSADGPADTVRVTVAQRVVAITMDRDSILFESLHAEQGVAGVARDRRGAPVTSATVSYAVQDTAIAEVDAAGRVQALRNGSTRVIATTDTFVTSMGVRIAQKPVRVAVPRDTIHLSALGDTAIISGIALDSLGSAVAGVMEGLSVSDSSVVTRIDSVTVSARANGTARVTFGIAGVEGETVVRVRQVARSLTATLIYHRPILTLPVGGLLPLECQGFDANGFLVPDTAALASTTNGTVAGQLCTDIRVAHSGFDTLLLVSGSAQARIATIVAAAPVPSSALGEFIVVDSFPNGTITGWAPTLRRNASGEVELYAGTFSTLPDSTGFTRGDLSRFVWTGGADFRYAGPAIRHDDDICSPQGQGIENIGIVPRADGPGWRMFYAAGSNKCYGWQVFSAVSLDEVNWTKEAGIRLSNGSIPGVTFGATWPVGEGMVIDRLPSGEWRMIVGSFEHVSPPENKWQIAEWRSTDQLDWVYVGPVITTRDLPPEGNGSVYSPTITEFAPGIWRMAFTADDRLGSTPRSKVWTAVSIDRSTWQLEGELLGAQGSNLYYSSLVDDRIVFIRRDGEGPFGLATAAIQMP
jgi:hypothetical protein